MFPAWLALLATLFSAVSPAIAAAVLTERPAALARMLGIPATAAAPAEETCDEHSGGHHAQQESAGTAHHDAAPAGDGKAHRDHGIYCSFCLTASSTAAVLPVPPALVLAATGECELIALQPLAFPRPHRVVFRSRAPPGASPVSPA
jgi:hypothetical protein